MSESVLIVRRYTVRVRHGGFHCHGTERMWPVRGRTYARCFACECGEPLHDGDPIVEELCPHRFVHANCAEVAA